MNIARSAMDNNRITAMLLLIVVASGWMAFLELPRSEDPGFIIRTAQVTTRFPGASPERVERLVTDRLEKAIQEIPELDFVASTSKTGLSIISVNIKERYRNMRPIWDALRRKVSREASKLPQGVLIPEVDDEFGDVYGIVLGLTGDGYSYRELKDIADAMRDEILRLPDAAKVVISGVQEERVFIEFEATRLAQAGISPQQLAHVLQSRNIVSSGGKVLVGQQRIAIEPSGSFHSVDQIGDTVIELPAGKVVYLRDLTTIRRGYVDPPAQKVHTAAGTRLLHSKRYSFPHRAPPTAALVLAVSMRDGGQLTKLGDQVQRLLGRFNAVYPVGVQIDRVFFQPHDVREVIDGFSSSLLQAVAIVMVAIMLFLGFRVGLVVSALIPTAIAATLLLMRVFGIGLDQISLAALIIALGMLVDNGVVMAEATMVRMAEGKDVKEAAVASVNELWMPLLISSLTTSAAFLPIFLAKSMVGEYTASLFIVVTMALISSWLLSITMTPLLCSLLLRGKIMAAPDFDSRFYHWYRRFLLFFVRRRVIALTLVLLFFVLGMQLFGLVPKIFFPQSDRPTFEVELELADATHIRHTRKTVQALESFMHRELRAQEGRPGITGWASFIGAGSPRYYLGATPEGRNSAYAFILATQTDRSSMDGTMHRLRQWLRENAPDARTQVRPRSLGPPVKFPIQLRVRGKDSDTLFGLVERIKAKMRGYHQVENISDDWGMRTKKLVVEIDQARARRAGITSADVAQSLQTLYSGIEVTQYREGIEAIPVTLRSSAADRHDLAKLETLDVYAQASGRTVMLKQVASTRLVWQPATIKRRDRYRTVTINGTLKPGELASVVNAKLGPWLEGVSREWPLGFAYEMAGEEENSGKANQSINDQLPTAFFIIVMLLVWQFNSLRRPLIILVTLPLALVGVGIGLLLGQSYFGFMTFLGVISLFGIVINNAIVLLDRIQLEIAEGAAPNKAIIMAAQQRLRPILLTTATTVLGLLPLWFGGSPMFQPMAIALIFGLTFGTLLTLGVVPLLYRLFFRVSFEDYPR